MNFVEMYARIFVARVRGFIRKHIIANDPHNDLSNLDMKDRSRWTQ